MANKTVAQYKDAMRHAIGGDPDARIQLIDVLNEAVSFVVNSHDWKFRLRPVLDVTFTPAPTPAASNITAISRASNITTVTLDAPPVPPLAAGVPFTIAGVSNTTFNAVGVAIASVIDTVNFTYINNGTNGSSSGGTVIATSPPAFLPYVDLPADTAELLAVCTKNNAIANVLVCTLEEIAYRRGSPNAIAYDGLYRVTLTFPGQPDVSSDQPGPRLEIWPTPSASNPLGDLSLTYRGGAIELVNDSDVANLPPKFARLITITARLFVQQYEEDEIAANPLWTTEFTMLKQADGRQQLQVGQLKGGAVQQMNPVQIREFRQIANPQSRM